VAAWGSAIAEDLLTASSAGQYDTRFKVHGEEVLIDAVRRCQASLFTDRAIGYSTDPGPDRFKVNLSVAAMQMVRSDLASGGVMFSIDPESGHARPGLHHRRLRPGRERRAWSGRPR
jgi:pyruvate, water dikinase